MPQFYPSWMEWGRLHGLAVTEDDFYGHAGWPVPDILRDIYEREKGCMVDEALLEQLLREYKAIQARLTKALPAPSPVEATVDVARMHAAAGVPIVAATSGLRETVERHLREAGLADLFPPERIVTAADIAPGRGKPKPDIFLRAAESPVIGADPKRCVAYEDAEAGFEAAWRAGCQVVDVRDFPGYPMPAAVQRALAGQGLGAAGSGNEPLTQRRWRLDRGGIVGLNWSWVSTMSSSSSASNTSGCPASSAICDSASPAASHSTTSQHSAEEVVVKLRLSVHCTAWRQDASRARGVAHICKSWHSSIGGAVLPVVEME
eukprot:CAMPEP_0171074362 /NCGR_PEP_ID=MMETSP0766_2-20121228/12094_1 /TAXON_ID=439317 /ORGANISM="Gambierdiscus australes, Strain CAWD 149" /LENGTH=318 /DNA_ID=CAMNT_0011531145 /DNA_START=36 /DNA_END=990 /DNA_ORIENTATION=+